MKYYKKIKSQKICSKNMNSLYKELIFLKTNININIKK